MISNALRSTISYPFPRIAGGFSSVIWSTVVSRDGRERVRLRLSIRGLVVEVAQLVQFSASLRLALVGPALIAAAASLWALYLPPRSPWLMPIIPILFLCGFTALLSVVVAVTRLLRDQSTRLLQNVVYLFVGAMPALLFVAWYSLALYG
jgi:hypothetical protein